MEWTIQEVARKAGTTSRTLRHYDQIGLLSPSHIGHNGYRYYDATAVVRLQRILLLRELGMGLPEIAEVLSRNTDEIAALEPELQGRFPRGLFFETEAHLNPRAALQTLRDRLAEQDIVIEPEGTPTGLTIDARGYGARDELKDLRGVRGEMLVLRCPEVNLTRTVRMLHPRIPLYIVPRGDGIYMIGATMLETGGKYRVTVRSAVEMLNAAYALHPGFAEAEILELGSDARPAFPDNLPRLRRRGNTLYANGLYRHGYLLAPAVARMTADYIQTGQKPEFMDEDHP